LGPFNHAEWGDYVSARTLLVLTTCGNATDADELAARLVEQRLAACVNAVNNVSSTYRWLNGIQKDQETLLIIKTTEARFAALEQAIRRHSKYELPEVVAIAVEDGSRAYLEWLRESVAEAKD
jgi:periplasmic divalent cation tolerance protein